ncbi:MAG: hypothetical protein ABIH23_13330 [bacterium]
MRENWALFVLLSLASIACSYVVDSRLGLGLVDDAYISMRYARNWADGIGPFFNPDERVEGYTNFLWTFFLYLGACLGADPPGMATFLGRICVGLTVPVTFFLAWNLCGTWIVASLAVVFLVSDAGWWAWSLSGLETPLLALFFVAALAIHLRRAKSLCDWIALSVLSVCAALTRPEGGALFLFILARELSSARRERCPEPDEGPRPPDGPRERTRLANLAILVGIFGGIYLSYLLWRRWTYGLWLPNSFYAKHGFAGVSLFARGAVYVWRVFAAHPLWAVILLGIGAGGWKESRFRTAFLFAAFFLCVVVLSGGDHFTLGRFCVPLLPILSVLTAAGFQHSCSRLSTLRHFTEAPRWRAVGMTAIVLSGIPLGVLNASWTFLYREGGRFHRSEVEWAEAWGRMGLIWRETVEPGTVVAVTTAGALPYVSSLPAIDILGINDHHISQRDVPLGSGVAGHEKGDADYVMRRRPQMIQIAPMLLFQQRLTRYTEVKMEKVLTYPAQKELAEHPVFKTSYEYITTQTRFGYLSYHRYLGKGQSG